MAKAIVLLIGIAAFTGCAARATPSEPRLVSMPDAGARPVYRLEAIFDYRTAAATVVTIAQRDLRFGTFPVTFEFHSNRAAFERRLLGVGYDPGLARSTAQTMTAVGGHRRVLINEGHLDRMPWPARLALLAHELGHSLQYELGGGTRGTSDQWLREGFADWLSIRVLERLDAASMSEARATRRREFRAAGRSAPRLDDLVTFRQWVAAGERQGPAAYALAFLAVDFLLARHDLAPVVQYFGLFAASQDRMGNFRRAFGQDLESFQAEFEASLRR